MEGITQISKLPGMSKWWMKLRRKWKINNRKDSKNSSNWSNTVKKENKSYLKVSRKSTTPQLNNWLPVMEPVKSMGAQKE